MRNEMSSTVVGEKSISAVPYVPYTLGPNNSFFFLLYNSTNSQNNTHLVFIRNTFLIFSLTESYEILPEAQIKNKILLYFIKNLAPLRVRKSSSR